MSSTIEYAQFVADQLNDAGTIVCKKLFGEYGLWCNGIFFGTVENNQFYVKVTEAGERLLPGSVPVAPHGGKPGMYLVENLDDREFLNMLTEETCKELGVRKRKKPVKRGDKK